MHGKWNGSGQGVTYSTKNSQLFCNIYYINNLNLYAYLYTYYFKSCINALHEKFPQAMFALQYNSLVLTTLTNKSCLDLTYFEVQNCGWPSYILPIRYFPMSVTSIISGTTSDRIVPFILLPCPFYTLPRHVRIFLRSILRGRIKQGDFRGAAVTEKRYELISNCQQSVLISLGCISS